MMINRKDTPAPFMQRAEPSSSSWKVKTATTAPISQEQPPQTPQNKPSSQRASKIQRDRETYTETYARGSVDEATRAGRISHDLNLTDNPRGSVVDNMLMSLNPDQPKLFSPSKDHPPVSSGSEASVPPDTPQSRPLYSSSTNSDDRFHLDGSPDRRRYHFGKGRRSNSSSNFPTILPRIDSLHAPAEGVESKRSKASGSQRTTGMNATVKGHTRRTSKGSGSSSMDYGQSNRHTMTIPQNVLGRRSASFDQGYARKGLHSASSSGTHPTMPRGISQPLLYNDIEAAPMPTVPVGPRRGDQSPAFAPSNFPVMQRRNSNKSSKSLHLKKGAADSLQVDGPTHTTNRFLGSRRASRQAPSTTSNMRSRNPSPTRHSSEQHPNSKPSPSIPPKDVPRDRPGFFRRVFGSSRAQLPGEALSTQQQNLQARTGPMGHSADGQATVNRLYKPPAMEDLTQSPAEKLPPQIVKKPSSFFRRRKKSVSENIPTPVVPPHLQANFGESPIDPTQHSPTSSLRRVMNPYLDGPKAFTRTAQPTPLPKPAQNTSAPPGTGSSRQRPSTEPVYQDSTSSGDTKGERRHREVPKPLIDTSGTKGFLNPNGVWTKPTENSFLYDDSSESRTPELKENLNPSQESWSRAPTSILTALPPRSTSKNAMGKPSQAHKGNFREPDVLSPRDTNASSAGRSNAITSKRTEGLGLRPDNQATKPKIQPSQAISKVDLDRMWLQPSRSDENLAKGQKEATSRTEGTEHSPGSEVFHSATSVVHPLRADDIQFPKSTDDEDSHEPVVDVEPALPTDEDRRQAKFIFDGDETTTPKSMAAAWLGEPGLERARVRKAYMELFTWQNLNILAALRDLCGRLYLKGESQQVDRILDAFSVHWCYSNPLHGFKATDVVHTICYSILLLNTDLHQAEIETKMTRTQFLRNIMPTIRRVAIDAAPDAFTNPRASTVPPARSWDQRSEVPPDSPSVHDANPGKRSFEGQRPVYRLTQRPSDQTVYTTNTTPSALDYNTGGDCGPLVKTPFHGKLSSWETQIEIVLKDFYHTIRQQPLPLFGSESKQSVTEPPPSATSLSAATSNFLRRTPSMLSKAGSENQSYSRGRVSDNRLGTGRWQAKARSRPRLYPASTVTSSRRSSFDEGSSVTSPSMTSAWSRFSSLGKTQTTMSTDSLASRYPQPNYQQSIGFANALSQAIIREEGVRADEESLRAAPLLEDESLELHGAPWAKEGILKHKHHFESLDKRAKDRNWVESFAVIEKGQMRLFSFNMNAKSLRQKAKSQRAPGGVVGGGNWADNAELLGSFVLRQSLASGLPEPGYSKARPHVWALSLPTGAIHLFQCGTPDIVKEFVATVNYWSARLSKEPLVGGVSNIEYGWSDSVINAALIHPIENASSSGSVTGTRPSLQSSIRSARSSMDQGSYRPKLPGDKIMINDWTPPTQSMVASALMEVDQLKALSNYVKNIEEELQRHNELRGAVLLAVSHLPTPFPRSELS